GGGDQGDRGAGRREAEQDAGEHPEKLRSGRAQQPREGARPLGGRAVSTPRAGRTDGAGLAAGARVAARGRLEGTRLAGARVAAGTTAGSRRGRRVVRHVDTANWSRRTTWWHSWSRPGRWVTNTTVRPASRGGSARSSAASVSGSTP